MRQANYTEHEVTPELLGALWGNLWERGEEELRRIGLSKEEALLKCLVFSEVGYARILCADGKPVMVAGFAADGGGPFTFMQASKSFGRHYGECVRRIRKTVQRCKGDLFIYSSMVHPRTERFFNALGFVRDDWQGMTAAGWPLYRFKRKD